MRSNQSFRRIIAAIVVLAMNAAPVMAAKWSITRTNHITIAPPNGTIAAELSGVTYLGPVAGAITAVSNTAAIPIAQTLDFEGVAYTNSTRNSVFLSSEGGAGPVVREFDLATGAVLQSVSLPATFASQDRAAFGLESLTRSPDASVMWTANEQALTGDGPVSTAATGTIVRLQKLNVAADAVSAGAQYAYQVEPIHGTSTFGSPQSGLSDLVALPDGTLITLERSVALLASPSTYFNRIYEVDLAGATDVSTGATAAGLTGQTYTKVGKELLWSGAADGSAGQNLEGLTLGPRLPNGDWILIGVVDDGWNAAGGTDSDPVSNNTVVAFTLSAIESADFDADGDTDGSDFLMWQRGVGQAVGASFPSGDATRDGAINGDDLEIWRNQFTTAEPNAGAVPEPPTLLASVLAISAFTCRQRRTQIA